MASNPEDPDSSEVSLNALKLRAGLRLQAQRVEMNPPTYEAEFLGVIEGKCVMVVPVGTSSIKYGMKAGENFIISGFTGQYDFRFTSKVIQAFDFTFREPSFAYAVLAFPESAQARKVRNSMRIRVSLPATAISIPDRKAQAVTLLDLSAEGALARSDEALGAIGDAVSLEFSMGPDGILSYVDVVARVRHVRIGDDGYLTGLWFETISSGDRLLIRELVLANAG